MAAGDGVRCADIFSSAAADSKNGGKGEGGNVLHEKCATCAT